MGTKNSVNQKVLSEEYLNSHSSHWMYCPRCFLIPAIKPFLMKGELYISLYCKCLYEEKEYMLFEQYVRLIMKKKVTDSYCKKHKSMEGFLFCISCEKWLCDFCFLAHKEKYSKHLYNKIPLRLKEYCHSHEKEQAVGYCKNCSKNICENCKQAKLKLRHDIFSFDDENNIDRCNKKWNDFIETQIAHSTNNEKYKEEIIKLIQNSKDISEDEKKNIIKKVNNAFIKNKQINDKICEFILFLYSNFDYSYHIGNIVNRNIFNNIYNIKLDHSTFSIIPEYSPKRNAEKLIKYYEKIHIIQLIPLINIKNINSDRQNVTEQISKVCLLDGGVAATLTSKGIVIFWNYITYDELYRIKKITVNEKTYLEKNENDINIANTMNNLHNFLIGDDDDDDEDLNNNLERIIRQQTHIFNMIQNNNHINNNNNKENKKINLIKVYHVNNSRKLNLSSDMSNQNEINNDKINEDEEEGLDLNYNFTSIAYIRKNHLLCLIIKNCRDIYLFDFFKKEALKQKLIGHKNEVLDILTLKNDNLASYGKDLAIRIWNVSRLQNITTINVEIKKYYIYFTQLLYGNLIFATNESVIKILKIPEYEFDIDITCVPHPMNYFELPDKRLIISSDDYYVRILKPPEYKEVTYLFNKKRTKIYSFLLLDKKRLLVGLKDYSIQIIYLNDKTHKNSITIASHFSPIGTIVKTIDRVISISWDNVVKIFLIGD